MILPDYTPSLKGSTYDVLFRHIVNIAQLNPSFIFLYASEIPILYISLSSFLTQNLMIKLTL